MGCGHSKKSKKGSKSTKDGGKRHAPVALEKQLERFEWQMTILKEVLSVNGGAERAELLKEHADEEVCTLVLGILDKVKTETAAHVNLVHQQQSKKVSERHQQHVHELTQAHEEVKGQLIERFHEAENTLKGEVSELKAELECFKQLKRRVQDCTFKKDLIRNIKAHGSPGAFWESEQESLLFVIEMKSERVQEQNRKLQQMEELTEKKKSVEERLIQVSQHNDDLRGRLDNTHTVLQQLSREHQDLKVALERQLALNQTLAREKEQLVFKMADSCPAINMAAARPVLSQVTPL
ncbi:coiled-coil domain-containing protein 69 isoform X2 [Entelurus aequoreus]|uniref:coiled-coil domain-containing protein 69 isoform X2 n=1 Tax=Entelurus aequoreus TaxID=161455 RepID=UPI002B1E154F|nr:coiled-coil domain-containing protein 69 isoform X2 [Entelurus aequoreus]